MRIAGNRMYCMTEMKQGYYIVVLLLMVCVLFGCASSGRKELISAKYYFDSGMEFMGRRDYVKAIESFQTIVDSYQGSEIIDQAQYMLAEAHYKNEDYITAAYEYNRVYTDFPSSEYAPKAMFMRSMCFFHESPRAELDQENTHLAIDQFNRFIDNFPRHELVEEAQKHIEELHDKLALKLFKNAETYRKLKKYEAAIIYYRYVINDYPRSEWADKARFGIGRVYIKQEKFEQARDMFQIIINSDAAEELKKDASKKLIYIERRTS